MMESMILRVWIGRVPVPLEPIVRSMGTDSGPRWPVLRLSQPIADGDQQGQPWE